MKDFINQKILLYKIREIVVNEIRNPYYKNAANVHEVVDLGTKCIERFSNKYQTVDYVKNMYIYMNGYIQFNNFIRTTEHFPEVKQQKNYQKNRNQKNTK